MLKLANCVTFDEQMAYVINLNKINYISQDGISCQFKYTKNQQCDILRPI